MVNQSEQKKINWGIIGTANIAKKSVIPGIQQSETGVVAAIASRGIEKAEKAAQELGIERAYGSYEELLQDQDIDAVYIPLPNHLHKEWTLKAAEAGKHVLCEKPLALNAEEAKEMVEKCQSAGVKLAEAFMYRYHPRYERVKEIIQSGEIGTVRGLHGAFTFNNAGDKDNVRYKQFMGGGSVYDVGCYPISVARFILESEPEAATVQAFFSPEHDDVDMMASGLLEFPNSVGMTFDCGMWADFRNTLQILGTEGRIDLPSAFLYHSPEDAGFYVTVKGEQRFEAVPDLNQYALQADEFGKSILTDAPIRFPSEDAVRNMRVIDACLKSARERARVSL
jgi:xylose dehydrogenase (NAD/NADP)